MKSVPQITWPRGRPWRFPTGLGLAAVVLMSLTALVVSGLLDFPAHDGTRLIKSDAALARAIKRGGAGETWLLAPGTYKAFSITGADMPDVVRSADPEAPAVLSGVHLQDFEGLVAEDLIFKYTFDPADKLNVRPFSFARCSDLTLRNNRFVGSLAHDTGTSADGFAYAIGLSVRFCRGVKIENNHFSVLHRGLLVSESRDVRVTGNEVTRIRMDGMVFAQLSNAIIDNNHIHSFRRTMLSEDHADMIQFWTQATSEPSRNIQIKNNIFNSGDGRFTQTIFMRNELVDKGVAGESMFYQDILIEENVIINAHLHGISLGQGKNVTIRRNTLVQNPKSADKSPGDRVWRPMIRVAKSSRNVRVTDNITSEIVGYENQPDWRVEGNLMIQNNSVMAANYYGTIFSGWSQGDPALLETYRYRAGLGPVGAGRLRR